MSNLLSIHNSKNQVGIGTNNISVSSSLTIKEDSKRYIVFNTGNDSIDTHRTIELEDETTLSTVKTNSISSPKLLYIASNSIISSLSFSSSANTYLRVSNTGGLGLVDKIAPIVQSISATDGTYGFTSPNNIIDITVTFNETVTVTGTPSLTLSNSANASYISGDNSTSILFRYTIQQSDSDSSSLSVASLSGTIEDLSGNPCTSINGTLGSVVVDTTIATVVSFIISNTSLKIGETATVTLQFSESVSGFNSDNDITEQNGSLATMTSSDNITWTGTFTPTDDIEDTTNILQLATSYTDSAGNSGPTAQTANYSIDTKEPILSNASSIGTTTDTTPTFSFTSSEAGTIISSLGFSTSNTAIANSNSITFNTLSNNTYSSQWVKVIDAAGNTSNQLLIPSFTVAVNPYGTTDLRYYMWEQNHSNFSGSRGTKGYSWIQTQRHDSRTGEGIGENTENPATDKNNFLYYETGSTSDISGIVSGSPDAGTVNLLYAGNWRDTNYHGKWGFVYDDNTDIVDEHIWQFEYKGNDTYGNYYHIINTQVQYNYNNSSWQGPNHQIGNCLGPSSAANNTSMRATTSNGGEWYCYVNHVSGTSSPPKFTIKIYNNGSAPTHELYMYVLGNSYSYERMNWKYGSSYTVSSSDAENNMQNNFTMKFSITNLSYAEP
jgi:hypothetical protein